MSASDVKTVLVSAGVVIEYGKVLLSERKKGDHLEGKWEFPGGHVEPGEDPRDALARELREELGIECTVHNIVELTFHRYPHKTLLLMFFLAKRKPGSPDPQCLDVAAWEWVDAEALMKKAMPEADAAIVAKVHSLLLG
jgi:8-oxo-dGTP diphosphatase